MRIIVKPFFNFIYINFIMKKIMLTKYLHILLKMVMLHI